MKNNQWVERTIQINAPVDHVWRVFIDPKVTRKMGGEYITDWKPGSSFGWRSSNGQMLTHGTVLEVHPKKLIKHNLFTSAQSKEIASVISYRFEGQDGRTFLHTREELTQAVDEGTYDEIVQGWDAALRLVKDLAEKI